MGYITEFSYATTELYYASTTVEISEINKFITLLILLWLQVETSTVISNRTTETSLINPDLVYDFYIPTIEPALIPGANSFNTKPVLSGIPGQLYQR